MSDSDNTIPTGFRVIAGYSRYAIDENGTILSICGRGPGKIRSWADAKRVRPVLDSYGYHIVSLRRDGKSCVVFVHKLVLTTFFGPCPQGMQCRHLDGCKTSNKLLNLAWGTNSENQQDRFRHGTGNQGDRNHTATLNDSDVLAIRSRAANGEKISAIAKDFPIHRTSIYRIVNRQSWKHI